MYNIIELLNIQVLNHFLYIFSQTVHMIYTSKKHPFLPKTGAFITTENTFQFLRENGRSQRAYSDIFPAMHRYVVFRIFQIAG